LIVQQHLTIDPARYAADVRDYLAGQEQKTLLRFLTCGSVDDGKSTLIDRLLYDTKLIFEDQLSALERDSRKHGTTGDDIDFALLVDGLEAEREQGITIDVAYRFFATPRRKFIVAEMLTARTSERQGRLIDRDESGSMEKKKREGYF
jgi:bifunctional enzyme CysN/CysC